MKSKKEIENMIKKLIDTDTGNNRYVTIVNRGSINALKWVLS